MNILSILICQHFLTKSTNGIFWKKRFDSRFPQKQGRPIITPPLKEAGSLDYGRNFVPLCIVLKWGSRLQFRRTIDGLLRALSEGNIINIFHGFKAGFDSFKPSAKAFSWPLTICKGMLVSVSNFIGELTEEWCYWWTTSEEPEWVPFKCAYCFDALKFTWGAHRDPLSTSRPLELPANMLKTEVSFQVEDMLWFVACLQTLSRHAKLAIYLYSWSNDIARFIHNEVIVQSCSLPFWVFFYGLRGKFWGSPQKLTGTHKLMIMLYKNISTAV